MIIFSKKWNKRGTYKSIFSHVWWQPADQRPVVGGRTPLGSEKMRNCMSSFAIQNENVQTTPLKYLRDNFNFLLVLQQVIDDLVEVDFLGVFKTKA